MAVRLASSVGVYHEPYSFSLSRFSCSSGSISQAGTGLRDQRWKMTKSEAVRTDGEEGALEEADEETQGVHRTGVVRSCLSKPGHELGLGDGTSARGART